MKEKIKKAVKALAPGLPSVIGVKAGKKIVQMLKQKQDTGSINKTPKVKKLPKTETEQERKRRLTDQARKRKLARDKQLRSRKSELPSTK